MDPDGGELTSDTVAALVAQSPDAIIFADIDGTIRLWNEAATRVFGFSRDQALGANLDIIIPERFREAHWTGYKRAIDDRVTKYVGQALPTRAERADGRTLYVEMGFAVILDQNDEVLGALAQARDITERFEKDRADRRRLKELEQAAIDNASEPSS